MATPTIPIEAMFADYVDLFSADYLRDSAYGQNDYVYWIKPKSTNVSDLFNKTKFLNAILYATSSTKNNKEAYSIKQDLDTLSQLQLSCITPNIQLYRRDYAGPKNSSNFIERKFAFNNTAGSYEFEVSSFGNDYNPNRFSAGIKSIDYTFAGTNPAESERAIDVSITFAFSSFEALIGSQVSTPGDVSQCLIRREGSSPNITVVDPSDWINKDGKAENKKGVTRNFLSLITYPPSEKDIDQLTREKKISDRTDVYVPNYFEILLQLGWRTPEGIEIQKEVFKGKEDLVKSLNTGAYDRTILLSLVNHELTLNEEGLVELKVNYIGSFETKMMGTADIDFVRASRESLVETESAAEDEDEKLSAIVQFQTECSERGGGSESIKEERKRLEEKIKERKIETNTPETNTLNNLYNAFLQTVLEEKPEIIKYIKLNKTSIENYDLSLTINPNNRNEEIFNQILQFTRLNTTNILTNDEVTQKVTEASKKLQDGYKKQLEAKEKESEDPSSLSSLIDNLSLSSLIPGLGDDDPLSKKALKDYEDEYVFYFSFGELLDLIVKFISDNTREIIVPFIDRTRSPMDDIDIILGDFIYTKRYGANNEVLLPISTIPITLNSFLIWFKDYITSKQRTNYPFRELLNDLLNGLLVPALKGITIKNGTIGGTYAPFVEYVQNGTSAGDARGATPLGINRFPIFPINYFIDQDNIGLIRINPGDIRRTMVYISLVQRGTAGKELKSVITDRRDGISHFYVGDTRGMVKSIKFKRIDQPGLREAKATKDGFIPLNQLRDLYNVDITMFGNHYYYPGQLIYVHPFISVMGEPSKSKTLSNIMGIGGYYDIIKVTGIVSNDNYETTLECVWSSTGEKRNIDDNAKRVRCSALQEKVISG